jgi:cell division protein FtsQ
VIRHRGGSPAASPAGAGLAAAAEPDPAGRPAAGTPSAGLGSGGPDAVACGRPASGRRRRADPWRAAFFILAAAAILAGAAWALLGSKFLVVRSVRVIGPAGISRAEVIADAGVRPGTPLIRIDPAAVARRVERITLVQSAQVRRAWPDEIVISVQERTPVFAVPSGTGYQLMDRFGVGLWYVRRPHGRPVFDRPAAADLEEHGSPAVQAAATGLSELPPRLARSVRDVTAPSADAVTLRLRSGVTIVWGGTGQPAAKSRELAILMRGHARYYNVSDPRTAVTGR